MSSAGLEVVRGLHVLGPVCARPRPLLVAAARRQAPSFSLGRLRAAATLASGVQACGDAVPAVAGVAGRVTKLALR